jgi:hypothetical protein
MGSGRVGIVKHPENQPRINRRRMSLDLPTYGQAVAKIRPQAKIIS